LTTATSGAAGLEVIKSKGPFAIVMSDMRMPGMSGAEFLSKVREGWPNTVRVLLTGQSDLPSAIAAVNDGQIFRF
jgi:DNA-binding NtrC family response regulator